MKEILNIYHYMYGAGTRPNHHITLFNNYSIFPRIDLRLFSK